MLLKSIIAWSPSDTVTHRISFYCNLCFCQPVSTVIDLLMAAWCIAEVDISILLIKKPAYCILVSLSDCKYSLGCVDGRVICC